MKKLLRILFCATLIAVLACVRISTDRVYDASKYGVLPSNDGETNSKNLQALIDKISPKGGIIYIPEGKYRFSKNGTQTIGEHCIKMRSNITIRGTGEKTVLMPEGQSQYGLDMFYFNDYLDLGLGNYLENCNFEYFVIDAISTSCENYTSAGKGFMLNLIRNCHWRNVTVKNTDATGFGVDCPVSCSITDCIAIGCGKAASEEATGASGFGIGYGYASGESMRISNCIALDNLKFGFFFEHQGRFDEKRYCLTNRGEFYVFNCTAENNLYNFGGICAENVRYRQCVSSNARKQEIYFQDCKNCTYNDSKAGENAE